MSAAHIRENIITEADAINRGLPTGKDRHYHGLGETLFLDVINDLDDVDLAYRGTQKAKDPTRRTNYFLLISKHKDTNGNRINVPIYIDEKVNVNRVFIDVNQIATVFGRDSYEEYLQKSIKNGYLVRIKKAPNPVNGTALVAGDYRNVASLNNSVSQGNSNSNAKNSDKMMLPIEKEFNDLENENKALKSENRRFANRNKYLETEKEATREKARRTAITNQIVEQSKMLSRRLLQNPKDKTVPQPIKEVVA